MPDQAPSTSVEDAADYEPAPAEHRSSIRSKLHVVLLLVGVVVVECLLAYLAIPGSSETAVMAGAVAEAEVQADSPLGPGDQADQDLEDQVEVDLGEFRVVAFQPISNTSLRIDFHLYGTVHADDKQKFDDAWRENTHRLRDQVITTVRGCELAELTDAGLGLIKRKILEKTNRTLGKPLLQAVIFSEFSFIEQ